MTNVFSEEILNLPEADVPIQGCKAYMSQGDKYQILFMQFAKDAELIEHSHKSQWAAVLDGKIDLNIGGVKKTYQKGDRYYIPENTKHSGKIYSGYADITYFDEKNRYKPKNR